MNLPESEIILRKDNSHKLKYILVNKIDQLGDFKFSDDSWYYKKLHKNNLTRGNYTITFHQVANEYKEVVKLYTLSCSGSVSHIQKKVLKIALFLKFLQTHYNSIELDKVTRTHVNAFEFELRHSEASINTMQYTYSAIQNFFVILSDFPEMPNVLPVKKINPFKQIRSKQNKLVSPNVIKSWDRTMKDDNLAIPLEFRVVYWLIRSFPNRITEVLSLKRDCLKTLFSEYVLQMPTFKQNGGYADPEIKPIPIIYTGHGKYVIDLIRKLQLQTEELVSTFSPSKYTNTDYLFTMRYWNFDLSKSFGIRYNPNYTLELRNWTGPKVNELFKQLAINLDIRDDNNVLVIPTTHLFRHQAITDRLYSAGYTIEQIRKQTGHKNQAMPKHYTHQLIEKHKEIHLGISELKNPGESPYEFRGKIINLDERTTAQLSKDPSYLTWEANGKKGVGICGDITGCNPKGTSVHFECYACGWFVPKLEYVEDYKQEYVYWSDVMNRNSDNPKRAAHFENAVRNVSYLERIIEICNKGIAEYNDDLINKLQTEKNIYELGVTNLINNGLLQAQQSKRNESIERVEWAVQFLKDTEGVHAKITAVKIADISGLSRVVLYKAHLRKIWDVSFNSNHSVNGATYEHMHLEKQLKDLQEQILQLDLKLQKKEQQLARSVKNLEKEKQRAQVYREDYEELKERHQRLLHYNLRILRKLHIHGVDTSDLGELHNEFEKSKGDKSYK